MILDFVTVAFGLDLPLLRLQARSMDRHLDRAAIGQILVIGNDRDAEGLDAAFRETVLPQYGALRDRVRYLPSATITDFAGTKREGQGWRQQQGLKLDIHPLIRSSAYVTLDCKNHFVRPTGSDAFVGSDGLIRTRPRDAKPEHMSAFRHFGIPEASWPDPIFHIVTPFTLATDEVAALDGHFKERGFGSVGRFLASGEDVYEYRLYCAFLVAHRGGWERRHNLVPPPATTFFARTDALENVMRDLDRPGTRILGIHRRAAWCEPAEKARIVACWLRFGLIAEAAEGEAILTPPEGTRRPV